MFHKCTRRKYKCFPLKESLCYYVTKTKIVVSVPPLSLSLSPSLSPSLSLSLSLSLSSGKYLGTMFTVNRE